MLNVLIVIAPLFLIIFLGVFLARTRITNEAWTDVLNNFALKIGLPALIFSALSSTTFKWNEEINLITANSALLVGSFVLAGVIGKLLRLNKQNFQTLFICLGFGNVAYLGIPTLVQIFTESILPTVSLIVAIYLFWMFTVGIGFLEYAQQKNRKNIAKKILLNLFKNPLLIAVLLGLLVSGLGISLPNMLNQSISMLAASVTPVVLIVIGLFIGRSKIGQLKEWIPVFLFSVVKLMIVPALFVVGIHLAGLAPDQLSASIIESAMPLAITPFALADEYKLNKGLIARTIVLSTILSVITIPFWTSII